MTADRYRAYAERIAAVSPSYAAWARSVVASPELLALLETVPPQQRQPELVFAVARRLGADPADPDALRGIGREGRRGFTTLLATATVQANDPRRLAPVLPLLAAIPGPIGLVDVGASAGLCSIPDRVTLDYRTPGAMVRMTTAPADPSITIVADVTGPVPAPFAPVEVAARVALDPAPIDLAEPGAFDRLVEAVPPEATDRTALMREAARAARAVPPVRIRGRVPGDLDRALDHLPDGCTPVVMTTGTLVYVPGPDRQRLVDRIRERGVRWVAMERTGILHGVAATLRVGADPVDPDAFATVSLDGVAVALADAFGTRIRWLGPIGSF
jgi:hypothetical protein